MNLPSMKRFVGLLGLATLGSFGTAVAQDEGRYLTLRTPQSAVTAQVTGNSVNSPDIQLTRDGKSLRGRVFGHTVFLGLNRDEVGGTVGSQLTRLVLSQDGLTHQARGNFLGTLMNLSVSPDAISGTVGSCGYELRSTSAGTYQGSRSCGGVPQRPVWLILPATLTEQGPEMTLATLALMLASY